MLLERERELGELEDALGEAREGRGCAVAIEAKAGLGKTRLLQAARRVGADSGFDVLPARASDLERDFPFALVRQLFDLRLAELAPEEREEVLEGATAAEGALGLGSREDQRAEGDSFAVLNGLYWVTAALAVRRPLLLAVDDAHSADAGSLDYLGFLLPRLEELPVMLVVTARPDEPDPSGGLGRILADGFTRHMALRPLSVAAAGELLEQELGRQPQERFVASCHEASGGNPFLLSELARTLAERGIEPVAAQADLVRELAPERVARTVLTRIAGLTPEAGALGRSLAIFGDDSEQRLVAELAGVDPDRAPHAADELRARSILDDGASLRFIHPLVRNAVYADIPAGERTQAHAKAAALLRERGAGPEQISTQLLVSDGREDREAVETLVEAGERALATGAPRSAIAYLTRALREPPPADLRAAVLGPLIVASFRAADHSAFAAAEVEIRAELERDPSLHRRWAIPLTMALSLGGRFEEAASMLGEAVEDAVAGGDLERAFQLEAQLSTIALLTPSTPEFNLERYADQIEPDSPAGRLAAGMEVRSAVVNGTAVEAIDAARRVLANDGVIFAEEPDLVASSVAVMTLVVADEIDAARYAAERSLAIAQQRGATTELVRGWFLRGFTAFARGDLIEAEADVRQAIDLARLAGIGPLVLAYAGPFINILIERDELNTAEAQLQATGMATGPMPDSVMFSLLRIARGQLRCEQGDYEQAVEDLVKQATLAERFGPGPSITASPWTVRALISIGERARARALADEIMVHARRWGAPGTVAHVQRAVALARGGAEGIELLEDAAGMLEDSPARLVRVQTLLELGRALRRDGRRAEARGPLREVLELARRGGMARIARLAREELQASGETVRRYAPIGVESLTPSERRVAEMAASGMSNRQIAQSLFVTVKTVEAHLSAAYDKLDIESRRQLAGALQDGSPP